MNAICVISMLTSVASASATRLAVGSRFGKYGPEQEKEVRKLDVKEDRALEQLKNAWRTFRDDLRRWHGSDSTFVLAQVKGLVYSTKDVETFSLALAEFQDEKHFSSDAGVFLNVLIDNGKDSDYVIHTLHLGQKIDGLGFENKKNIIVNGDLVA